jgi:hypothetical protein
MKQQVALVRSMKAGDLLCRALYVNGELIETDGLDYTSEVKLDKRADRLAKALDVTVSKIQVDVEGELDWGEIEIGLYNEGTLESPEKSERLMRGFYRCPSCYAQWSLVDDLNAAMDCMNCSHEHVEPFSSADPGANDEDPMVKRALAQHERQYPSPMEQGIYEVEVTRSAPSTLTIEVESAGPFSAQEDAINKAYNTEFPSGSDAFYDVGSYGKGE